jgi:hypothetical protein
LVRSAVSTLSQFVGNVLSLTDWQRFAAGVPTTAQECDLHEELAKLESLKQQEESEFHQEELNRRAGLKTEIEGLIKKSVMGGFVIIAMGTERLPLNKGESVTWNSPAQRLNQRSRQGNSHWDDGDHGTLFFTNQRIVFATPDAKRWQRPLAKMHTAQVDYGDANVPVLVLGFDDLQKPVAFVLEEVPANVTVGNCDYCISVTVTDVANMLQSRFSTN